MKVKTILITGLVAMLYIAFGVIGLRFATLETQKASAVWLPAGIALAAVWFGQPVYAVGVWLGSFVVNLGSFGFIESRTLAACAAIATGSTLQALAGMIWVRAVAGREALTTVRGTALFFLLEPWVILIAPTIGVSALAILGFAQWANFAPLWATWFIGDMAGVMLVMPLVAYWQGRAILKTVEFWLAILSIGIVSTAVFHVTFFIALPYFLVALVIAAAIRRGGLSSSALAFVISANAVIHTAHGHGPFYLAGDVNTSLIFVQVYVALVVIAAIVVSVSVRNYHAA